MSERRKINAELDLKELGGLSIEDVRCAACSGYGNCGYRQYRIHNGKPLLICQLKKKTLLEQKA
ncbi:MAG: hypothetical protein ACI36W_03615 [Coriobacteriales bacterium]